jgi:hypothetical protein
MRFLDKKRERYPRHPHSNKRPRAGKAGSKSMLREEEEWD